MSREEKKIKNCLFCTLLSLNTLKMKNRQKPGGKHDSACCLCEGSSSAYNWTGNCCKARNSLSKGHEAILSPVTATETNLNRKKSCGFWFGHCFVSYTTSIAELTLCIHVGKKILKPLLKEKTSVTEMSSNQLNYNE